MDRSDVRRASLSSDRSRLRSSPCRSAGSSCVRCRMRTRTRDRPTPSSAGSAQVPNWGASAWGQGAQSTKSFQPATGTFGWFASIATAGSFWWFCGVVSGGLPTLTSPASAGAATHNAQTRLALRSRLLPIIRNLPSARRASARRSRPWIQRHASTAKMRPQTVCRSLSHGRPPGDSRFFTAALPRSSDSRCQRAPASLRLVNGATAEQPAS